MSHRARGPFPQPPHFTPRTCEICEGRILIDEAYVTLQPSWERHNHSVHGRCWRALMGAASDGILRQLELDL